MAQLYRYTAVKSVTVEVPIAITITMATRVANRYGCRPFVGGAGGTLQRVAAWNGWTDGELILPTSWASLRPSTAGMESP